MNRSPIESADALEADRSNEALEADALEAVALEADALEADALEADAVEADALEATTKQTAVAEVRRLTVTFANTKAMMWLLWCSVLPDVQRTQKRTTLGPQQRPQHLRIRPQTPVLTLPIGLSAKSHLHRTCAAN